MSPPSAEAGGGQPQAIGIETVIRALAGLVAVAAALYLSAALYAGWRDLLAASVRLGAAAVALGLLLAFANFLLRFSRWNDVLGRLSQPVPAGDSLRIYLAGFALTATPGKTGETFRSAMLLRRNVPVAASLTAFLVDRLTDLIGVLLLAALSGRDAAAWWAAAALTLGLGFALKHAATRRLALSLAGWLERRGRLTRLARLLNSGLALYRDAWAAPRVALYVAIAMVAFGLQGLAFYLFVVRLWPGADWMLALHVFATSTLAGAASMIPGGLGAMELALIAQMRTAGMPVADATAAALALRAVTLWFAILTGLICLQWLRRDSHRDRRA